MRLFKEVLVVGLGVYFVGCSPQGTSTAGSAERMSASFSMDKSTCTFNGQILLEGESVMAYLFRQDPDGYCASEERVCTDGTLSGSFIYSSCNDAPTSCRFNGQVIPDGGSIVAYLDSTGDTCESEVRVCTRGVLSGSYTHLDCNVNLPQACSFNGETVEHGQTVTAYQNSSVPYGETCVSESRMCDDGSLSGSFNYSTCEVGAPKACLFDGKTIAHGDSVTAFLDSSVPFGESCASQVRVCDNGTLSGSYQHAVCEIGAPKSCQFNGQTVAHGQAVEAYQNSSVPYGETCMSEFRICENGTLSGSYTFGSCQVGAPNACQFNGRTVAHGEIVEAYQNSSVPYGEVCVSESRTCDNGNLSGSYQHGSCEVGAPSSCQFDGQTYPHGSSVTAYQNSSVPYGETCENETRTCDNGVWSGSYEYPSCQMGAPKACQFNGRTVAHGETVEAYENSSVPYGGTCKSETRTCDNGALSGSYENESCQVGAPSACLFDGKTIAHGETVTAFLDSSVPFGETCSSQERVCSNGVLSGNYEYPSCNVGAPKSCQFNGQTLAHGQTVEAFKEGVVTHAESCESETRTCNNGALSGSYQYGSCQVNHPEDPDDPEDEVIDDVVSENKACKRVIGNQEAEDLRGKPYRSNGKHSSIAIANAGAVSINGVSNSIAIKEASSVTINGNHDAICIKSKRVDRINGVNGRSGVPMVLIGQDSNSSVGNINGHRGSDLVLINMTSTSTINGVNEDIYISGGHVETVNGQGGHLYLTHGAVVDRINGNFKAVYVYPGSEIRNVNGKVNIVRP